MRGQIPGLAVTLVAAALVGGCSAQADGTASPSAAPSATPSHVAVPGAGDALLWGDGPYGLILLHDSGASADAWLAQGPAFAADRMTVAAPETISAGSLEATIAWMRDTRGVQRVAVLSAGDAAVSLAQAGAESPTLIDQAIVLSPPSGLDWRAEFPKLFAASDGDPAAAAAREATEQASGTWNVLLIVGGSASGQAIFASPGGSELLSGVLRRLDERR